MPITLYEKVTIRIVDSFNDNVVLGKKKKEQKKPQQAKNVKINTQQKTIKVYR